MIENRPGAGGTLGSEFAARQAPDGYTILAVSSAKRAIVLPEVSTVAESAGLEPGDLTPDQFAEFLKVQNERFASIIRNANIKAD